jgi:hypothetical protein
MSPPNVSKIGRYDFLVATHHDCQCPRSGCRATAAHRGIENGNSTSGGLPGELSDGVWMNGGMNRDTTTRAHCRNELAANLPETDIVHNAHAYVVGTCSQFGDARNRLSRRILKGPEAVRTPRPQHQRISGLDDTPRHRSTLTSEAYETDYRHMS